MAQSKVKSVTAGKKMIEQYCSVCKKTFTMPVVKEEDEVVWLKCPECHGYLPFMTDDAGDSPPPPGDAGTSGESETDIAPEDIDPERALEYSESSEYKVGDIIYHRSWNDYGRVMEKQSLPGNRKIIHVQFINQGKIRLLEGVPKKESS